VVTATENVLDESVRKILPDEDAKRYWRSALRVAALCHDLGHLPFSHAAENRLLPEGYDHERLTKDIISSPEMLEIWETMTPRLRSNDIIKLAIGPKKADPLELNTWESILSEIIIGDAFGADRMDYLLRDSLHAGVEYGKFDHNRLINTLRILPQSYADTDEPALGLESGGLESSEGLMVARYFMYKQVYLHPIRRVYDIHLIDFLKSWLPSGTFSTKLEKHLKTTDSEVLVAIRQACAATNSSNHILAKRIQCRDHFRYFYLTSSGDKLGGRLIPGKAIAAVAAERFGKEAIRYDYIPAKVSVPNFPVRLYDGAIESSLKSSPLLERLPPIEVDTVYCDKSIFADAVKWKKESTEDILGLK